MHSRPPNVNIDYAAHTKEIARALLGEPDKSRSTRIEWRWGNRGSLSVRVDRGTWYDHEAGEGGGVADLVRRFVGPEPGAVAKWLSAHVNDNDAPVLRVRKPSARSKAPQIDHAAERKQQRAREIWNAAFPALDHTPAEVYLRRRGVWEAGRDARLRFARLGHFMTREVLPAIIIPRYNLETRRVEGIQAIFLTEDGQKYQSGEAKLTLGRGALVGVLFRPQELIGLAEGLESALSWAAGISSAGFSVPCWATLGGFPATMHLPEEVRRVAIAADHDAPGTLPSGKPKVRSQERAETLASFIRGTGRHAEVFAPLQEKADANDVLKSRKWQGLPAEYADIAETLKLPDAGERFSGGRRLADVSAYPFASEYDDTPFHAIAA